MLSALVSLIEIKNKTPFAKSFMTEESIMEAVKRGDLQKASLLFDIYHKRLYSFFVRLSFDKELAQDLTQNVFLRLIRYRESYKEGMVFQAWIYRMARNVFADNYRKEKIKSNDFVEVEKIAESHAELEDDEMEEKEKLLHRSLSMLSVEDRELLILSRFQNMKYEEIAQITNTTVANIKVKAHRAIKKLREHYFELEKI